MNPEKFTHWIIVTLLIVIVFFIVLEPVNSCELSEGQKIQDSIFEFNKKIDHLTKSQMKNIIKAHEIGSEHDLGLAMIGICMQESLCGELDLVGDSNFPIGQRSYGIMHMRTDTAKFVLNMYPELGSFKYDELLISEIITNDEFAMTLAVHYLLFLKNNGLSWREMITAYNTGLNGMRKLQDPNQFSYTVKTIKRINELKVVFE